MLARRRFRIIFRIRKRLRFLVGAIADDEGDALFRRGRGKGKNKAQAHKERCNDPEVHRQTPHIIYPPIASVTLERAERKPTSPRSAVVMSSPNRGGQVGCWFKA